jgi:hypothetical protein
MNHPGICEGSNLWEDGAMNKSSKSSPKVREHALRLVKEHQG